MLWVMIIFVILAIVLMILVSWYLRLYKTFHDCDLNPEVWCWVDWYCEKNADPAVSITDQCSSGDECTPLITEFFLPNGSARSACKHTDDQVGCNSDGCSCVWDSGNAVYDNSPTGENNPALPSCDGTSSGNIPPGNYICNTNPDSQGDRCPADGSEPVNPYPSTS